MTGVPKLHRQVRQMCREKTPYGFCVDYVEDSSFRGVVLQLVFPATAFELTAPELASDLEEYSQKCGQRSECVLEARFKDLEMLSPPFVRMLRPRFKFHTGHVTIGGSICSPILTQQWDPSTSLEGLGKTRSSYSPCPRLNHLTIALSLAQRCTYRWVVSSTEADESISDPVTTPFHSRTTA